MPSQKKTLFAAALLGSASGVLASTSTPQAKLPSGDALKGSLCPGSQVKRFRGIPYAQPPTGSLRFMPPKGLNGSLSSHGGIFDASHAAAPCPQYNAQFAVTSPASSEDCLTIDVYMPTDAKEDANLPVKVWAYGGSNEAGATSYPLYDGCHLATDAVVVEYNYRVGPLGFLGLASAGIQGNMAIQDALAALQWVQNNVGSFGGDKSRVVLFGQSSGADDTFVISTLPEAPGLISAVIAQSGGGQFMTPYHAAQEVGASYAAVLNCSSDDLSCLQSRSLPDLAKAYQNIPATLKSTVPGQMIANVYNFDIPKAYNMYNAMLDGKIIREEPLVVGSKVPIMAGAAQNDAALFTIPQSEEALATITASNYTDFLATWGPDTASEIEQMYPLSAFNDTGSTAETVVAAITHVVNEFVFYCPSYFILQAAEAAGMSAYGYRFNHTPSCPWLEVPGLGPFPGGALTPVFGATHTAEIPFVFGNLDKMPFNNGTCNSTESEYAMSAQLTAAWTAMAARGNPATDSLDWPRYDSCEGKGVFIQDKAQVAKLDFSDCAFWGKILQKAAGVNLPYLAKTDRCTGSNGSNSTSSPTPSGTGSSSGPSSTVPASGSSSSFSPAFAGIAGLLFAALCLA